MDEKIKKWSGRKIVISVIILCAVLAVAGIAGAIVKKGGGSSLNDKELLKTSDVVRLLEKNGIELKTEKAVNTSDYQIKSLDLNNNEITVKPSVYLGTGKGDETEAYYFADERLPEERDVAVLIYELDHYVGGTLDKYPQYIQDGEDYFISNIRNNECIIRGKNIVIIFVNTASYPEDGFDLDTLEGVEIHADYYNGLLAARDLRERILDILFEKAFNGEVVHFYGESENWEVMMPVRCFYNEADIDLLGYNTNQYASGEILFKKKTGNIEDALIYGLEIGNSRNSADTGIDFVPAEQYEGWYYLDYPISETNSLNSLYAKTQTYSITLTDESGIPETIVAVREGSAYEQDTAAAEEKAKMRETELYKAVVPAMEDAIRSEYEPYVNIEKIVVADWYMDDISDDSAELTLNVMYSLYNKDLTRVDYLEELKVDSSEEIYQHYSEDYLASKMATLYYEVDVKTAEKVLANEYVISNTYKDGVICIEDVSPLTDQGDPVFDIYRFLDIYEKSDLVFEPGSKRVLHTSEVSVVD